MKQDIETLKQQAAELKEKIQNVNQEIKPLDRKRTTYINKLDRIREQTAINFGATAPREHYNDRTYLRAMVFRDLYGHEKDTSQAIDFRTLFNNLRKTADRNEGIRYAAWEFNRFVRPDLLYVQGELNKVVNNHYTHRVINQVRYIVFSSQTDYNLVKLLYG